jgi:hypothetical protein
MIEFNTYLPNPRAPTIFVNKIGGLHRLSTTITKLSLALSYGRAVVVASLICSFGKAPSWTKPTGCFAGPSTRCAGAESRPSAAVHPFGRIDRGLQVTRLGHLRGGISSPIGEFTMRNWFLVSAALLAIPANIRGRNPQVAPCPTRYHISNGGGGRHQGSCPERLPPTWARYVP